MILPSAWRSAEHETAIATGQDAPWRGSRTTRTSWQKYLPPNCAPIPNDWVSSKTFSSSSTSRMPWAAHRALGRQVVEVVRGGVLRGLERELRARAADDDGEVVRRARGGAERADLLVEELHQPRRVEDGLGLLEEERLVGRAAALGHEEELVLRDVLGGRRVELDLRRQVGAGVLLLERRQRRELGVAEVEPGVGVVHALADRLAVVGAGEHALGLLAHHDRGAGVLAHRQHAAGGDVDVLEQVERDEAVVAGRLGVVDDLAQLGEVAGPQVVADVVHRLLGEPPDRLGLDLEEGAPLDLDGGHALGGDQPVGRLRLRRWSRRSGGGRSSGTRGRSAAVVTRYLSVRRRAGAAPRLTAGYRRFIGLPQNGHSGVASDPTGPRGSARHTRRSRRVLHGGPVKTRKTLASLAVLATLVAVAGLRRSREGGRHHHRERRRRGDRHVGRGLRRHGRPRQGRPGGGRAQRHRAAARLGQLRRDHLDLRGEVRHRGQLRPARRAPRQDEINAANDLAGTDRAPDVFDLGQSVALANTDMFAPYQVETWDDIPAEFKDADGTWVNDYGGYMSIGYDSAKVPDVTSLAGPAQARVQGQGRPQRRPDPGRRRLQRRDDGRDRQRRLGRRHRPRRRLLQRAQGGRQLPARRPRLRHDRVRRRRPVVIDWDYLGAAAAANVDTWKTVVPEEAVVAGYYFQAINADAPHPAAARLWQEFLYSDEGQNLWLKGGARPVRGDAMAEAGTIDADLWGALPEVAGEPVIPTDEQTVTAGEYLADELVQGHQLSTTAPARRAPAGGSPSARYLAAAAVLRLPRWSSCSSRRSPWSSGRSRTARRRLHAGQHRGADSRRRRSTRCARASLLSGDHRAARRASSARCSPT